MTLNIYWPDSIVTGPKFPIFHLRYMNVIAGGFVPCDKENLGNVRSERPISGAFVGIIDFPTSNYYWPVGPSSLKIYRPVRKTGGLGPPGRPLFRTLMRYKVG